METFTAENEPFSKEKIKSYKVPKRDINNGLKHTKTPKSAMNNQRSQYELKYFSRTNYLLSILILQLYTLTVLLTIDSSIFISPKEILGETSWYLDETTENSLKISRATSE